MRVKSAESLFEAMSEGTVYRRQELTAFSKAVDRDLKDLLKEGRVKRAASGLYYRPKPSRFGALPPIQKELVRAFLKTDDFLLTSLNTYNSLGVGLTQLSNEMLVYNRKRVGKFKLGNLVYHFKRPLNFPKKLSEEFLVVDLLNNLDDLADPPSELWQNLKMRVQELSSKKLEKTVSAYGKMRTIKLLEELLSDEPETLAA